jgi:glycosyltransferase involved in cell wall biosynthesis
LSDIALAHAAETGIGFSEQAANAKLQFGTRLVLTCWETIPFAYEEDPVVRRRRAFLREHTDLFLATTCRASHALEIEGVSRDRIRVIMPGVDVARFAPGIRTPEALDKYGLESDNIVLLFIGRLIGEKGVRELVTAFALLRRSVSPAVAAKCRLLIAGTGTLRDMISSLINTLGVSDSARIIDGVDYMKIHTLHQLADVFVLPSIPTPTWEEQYGMVIAEAMACGKPVVSTRAGGVPEVMGGIGVLVPPLEPESLCDALRELVVDRSLREEIGLQSRERAVRYLNAELTARQLSDSYSALLAPKVK